jgi:hypothetical protein
MAHGFYGLDTDLQDLKMILKEDVLYFSIKKSVKSVSNPSNPCANKKL